jgi:catechol 2,3-dioxygenase-like lactoylglutathione lyase family enzyme
VPDIIGQVVILTVSDPDQSSAWYCGLLGAQEAGRYVQPDGHVTQVSLKLGSGMELCWSSSGAHPSFEWTFVRQRLRWGVALSLLYLSQRGRYWRRDVASATVM